MIHYDASETLKAIRIPALVVAGDRDTTTKPEASEWMTRASPRPSRSPWPRRRHMGLIEHNEPFDAEVGRFADACRQRTRSAEAAPGSKVEAPKPVNKFAGRARRAMRRSRRGH